MADWELNKSYKRLKKNWEFKIMGFEDCREIFWGDVRCTVCGSENVFEDEHENELLKDGEGSDYLKSVGSSLSEEEWNYY